MIPTVSMIFVLFSSFVLCMSILMLYFSTVNKAAEIKREADNTINTFISAHNATKKEMIEEILKFEFCKNGNGYSVGRRIDNSTVEIIE